MIQYIFDSPNVSNLSKFLTRGANLEETIDRYRGKSILTKDLTLADNCKYYYPITHSMPYSLEFIDVDTFKHIPILNLIVQGKVHLLLDQSAEEFCPDVIYLHKMAEEAGIPSNHIHYASCLDDAAEKYEYDGQRGLINWQYRDHHIEYMSAVAKCITPKDPAPTEYLYAALNAGKHNFGKVEMVYQLWANGLIDQGQVSLNKDDAHGRIGDKSDMDSRDQQFLNILPLTPKHWTGSNLFLTTPSQLSSKWPTWSQQFYDQEHQEISGCKFYISSETSQYGRDCYFTEKTVRALLHRRPFLINGMSGGLAKLQRLGFKTFSNYWSEDYDTIETQDQIQFAIQLLKDNPDLTGIEEITEYNFQHLKNTDWFGIFEDGLK
mgnify:FL=1|tara:strand:+ start:70 stop:1203 length:1134 start_codon:yes stop_codon:yes gene_type:complete